MNRILSIFAFAACCWLAGNPARAQLQLEVVGGITTDTELNSALTNDVTRKKFAHFQGDITIDETILVTNGNGGGITGIGQTEILPPGNLLQKAFSRLTWAGARTGVTPIIEVDRADPVLRDFSISGDTHAHIAVGTGTYPKAKVGIQLSRASGSYQGVGSGKMHMENVGIAYCEVGMRLGEALGDLNCDESTITDLFVDYCDVGVQFVNKFALGFHFIHPRFRNTTDVDDYCIQYFAGGNVSFTGAFISNPCTFIRFESSSDNGSGYGPNAATVIESLKIDNQAWNSKVVDMSNGAIYYAYIDCRNLQSPQHFEVDGVTRKPRTNPLFDIAGNTILVIDGARNLEPNCIEWDQVGSATPFVIVRNSTFYDPQGDAMTAADLFDTADSDEVLYYKAYGNCQVWSHYTPVADSTDLVDGVVDGWKQVDAN